MKYIIIGIIVGVAAFIGFKVYKSNLQQQVMKGYNIAFDAIKDKSISDLKTMLKTLSDNAKK